MHPRFCVVLAGIMSVAVAGCAGSNVTPGGPIANQAPQAVPSRLGRAVPAFRVSPDKDPFKNALYVADNNNDVITILANKNYRVLGTITDGISNPVSEAMDKRFNLYVANLSGADVTEYAPGTTSPSFTYNRNMEDPLDVAVDRRGNIYESDDNGNIQQYTHDSNFVTMSCPYVSGSYASGLAVDANGDVFASYPGLGIYEYTGGLSGCNPTKLNDFTAYSIALDSNNNLVCTGGYAGTVFVLDPPYTTVTRTIGSGLKDPTAASLNKKNKFVFIADYGNKDVVVFKYETGAFVKELGAAHGITGASAVVDAPSAVY